MNKWQFKLLYDGDCPLCLKEVNWLRKYNHHERLILENISDKDFNAGKYNKTINELMGSIHGVYPNGKIISGMEVFRQAYRAVGLGWIFAPTAWPVLKIFFDISYKIFARYRIKIGKYFGRTCSSKRCQLEKN